MEENKKVPLTWDDIKLQSVKSGLNYGCSGGMGVQDVIVVNFHLLEKLSCDGISGEYMFIVPVEGSSLSKIGIDPINKSISDQYHSQICRK